MEGGSQIHRIAMGEHVHVHREVLVAKKVIVKCGHLDSAFLELSHHRGNLAHQEHEVAHHHSLVAALPERKPGTERQCRLDLHAVERDLEITARQTHAIDASGHGGAGL